MSDNEDPDVQSKYPIASFTANGTRVSFCILEDELTIANRIVPHKRPYRPGAKLDSTGADPREWTTTALFNNSLQEPGLDQNVAQYPDNMNALLDLFAEQVTGDLVTPSDGNGRFRAAKAVRSTSNDEIDTAHVKLTFIEDNEDDVDATAFSRPNVQGSLTRLAEQTVFTAESEGVWNGNLADLKEFCANLEGTINAPGETIDSVIIQARAAQHACRDVLSTALAAKQSNSPDALANKLNGLIVEPPIQTIRALRQLLDIIAWAPEEHNENPPKRVRYQVKSITTIYQIASDVKQDPDQLMELNEGRIDDPFAVQPGFYRILASA